MKVLALDTSNYVSSVALVDEEGRVHYDLRSPVPVPDGQKGLRQSEALFHHIKNLPILLEKALFGANDDLVAIVVSSRPRNVDESYMPVFLAGLGQAHVLSAALDIPCIERSHQEGHIFSALASSNLQPIPDSFLAIHLSGGTSELVKVTRIADPEPRLAVELLGGTSDLNAGQFVDRVGVALGLPFPAGPSLEALAAEARGEVRLTASVQGLKPSFSGPCSHALRLIKEGVEPREVALAVENGIAKTLEKWLTNAQSQTGLNQVLISGGVSANQHIRQRLADRLRKKGTGVSVHFGEPLLSGDNSVGLALSYWYPELPRPKMQE